jgi:hypothetical protein
MRITRLRLRLRLRKAYRTSCIFLISLNITSRNIPAVHRDLSALGGPNISYSGEDFLKKVWQEWANETQADIVGLLNCGGAAIVSLQHIIGFGTKDYWLLGQDEI